jgi:hypothetical protein
MTTAHALLGCSAPEEQISPSSEEAVIVNQPHRPSTASRRRRIGLTAGLLGAGVAAGALLATALGANAESASTSGSLSAASTSASPGKPSRSPNDDRGSGPVRDDEKSVSASTAATLKAAALKAVPGGTVYRVETDAGDAAYEAHMTKADGTEVTVKFDQDLKVTKVESGMGSGDPAPDGGHRGHH